MLFPSLLGHAEELLGIVQNSRLPADSLVNTFFRARKYLGAKDRRFLAETLYGTLRHLSRCQSLVTAAFGPINGLSDEDRRLWTVLAFLTAVNNQHIGIPDVEVKTRSEEIRKRIPEILSFFKAPTVRFPEDPEEKIAAVHSFPLWMVKRFVADLGLSGTEQLCQALNAPALLTLRVNTIKTTVEECKRILAEQGVEAEPTPISPAGLHVARRQNLFQLKAFREGMFEVQDEGSQLLPIFIDPKPQAKVLDACAGGGGKSLQLAALMKNRGEIFASDINRVRLNDIRKRSKRAGAFNIRIISTADLMERAEEFRGFFDIVFVDAPCTGLGTLRRNPGMKWSVSELSVKELAAKQLDILGGHAEFLKPGGLLFYATCSVLREENEDVIRTFLDTHPSFSLSSAADHSLRTGLERFAQEGFFRLSPHRDNTDGFFCAVLARGMPEQADE